MWFHSSSDFSSISHDALQDTLGDVFTKTPGETPQGKAVKYLWEDPENQAFRRGGYWKGPQVDWNGVIWSWLYLDWASGLKVPSHEVSCVRTHSHSTYIT